MKHNSTTAPVFCGKDCGGNACPLLATIENGRVVRVTNNPAGGPELTGCRRGYRLHEELYSSARLQKPLIRRGERGSGDFREASWGEALDLVAARLGEIAAAHGHHAILNIESGGSTTAMHNTGALSTRFLNLFGGSTVLSSNYSNGAASFVLPYLFGSGWKRSGFDARTMRHSSLIILWGANLLEARLGTELDHELLMARDRGARIIVIDPRRTGTAKRLNARWIPCRPGTDTALMLALLYVLFTEGFADRASISTFSTGFDQLESYVLDASFPKTPRWASRICGIPEEEIRGFARTYGTIKPAMLFPGYSIQRVFAGEETYRLTVALQIATGNFALKGGSTGSLNNRLPAPRVGTMPVPPPQAGIRSGAEAARPLDTEPRDTADPSIAANPSVPVCRWPDAILQGKGGGFPSDIRAVYTMGCNFLNQGGDIGRNIAAFGSLDFAVCHELFLTPTARYCDVVLPSAHTLEREDIGIPWAGNFLAYKPRAAAPLGESRTDYDILSDLADRLGFGSLFTEGRDAGAWIRHFLDRSEITDREEFMRTGVYFGKELERTGLSDFAADPEGHPLDTPSGRVEIASRAYHAHTGFSPIPVWQPRPEDPDHPLLLVTPKTPGRTHSQVHSSNRGTNQDSHFLQMNPADAAARGIPDGGRVLIFNENGASVVRAAIDDDIVPGVVSLHEGIWVEMDSSGTDTAGSANVLTSCRGTMPGRAAIMHGVNVQVRSLG